MTDRVPRVPVSFFASCSLSQRALAYLLEPARLGSRYTLLCPSIVWCWHTPSTSHAAFAQSALKWLAGRKYVQVPISSNFADHLANVEGAVVKYSGMQQKLFGRAQCQHLLPVYQIRAGRNIFIRTVSALYRDTSRWGTNKINQLNIRRDWRRTFDARPDSQPEQSIVKDIRLWTIADLIGINTNTLLGVFTLRKMSIRNLERQEPRYLE